MGVSALGGKARLAGLVARHLARAGLGRVMTAAMLGLRVAHRTPDTLLIAPHDLRTTDPTRAAEFYAGAWFFAGRKAAVDGGSPFLVQPPTAEWAEALHGFGWLRHLRAADTTIARANGRALVEEWIALSPGAVACRPDVAARRLISWFCHAPLILDGADRVFYRKFLRSIARQVRRLEAVHRLADDGAPRLTVAIALAYAGLCVSGETRLLRTATARLAEELDRQVLADGGHVSRNPEAIVSTLLDLLPLRQAFVARDVAPPRALFGAIDRMMPMLRFFRHADGEFAQFNGSGATQTDLIATLLAYDDARGAPVENAPHSGYQRLTGAGAVVLVETGPPPPPSLSQLAHAGCLSFEFSSLGERIVVNCGAPRFGRADWAAAARATAAHSTAVIGEVSSAQIAPPGLRGILGAPIVRGPHTVEVSRDAGEDGVSLAASHDGYAEPFGVRHERRIELSRDGRRLSGVDAFPAVAGTSLSGDPTVVVRFHLHPMAKASATQDGRGALIATPGGEAWAFSVTGATATLEDSVYLSGAYGPRRSSQIVIATSVRASPRIAWSFATVETEPQGRGRRMPQASNLFMAADTGD